VKPPVLAQFAGPARPPVAFAAAALLLVAPGLCGALEAPSQPQTLNASFHQAGLAAVAARIARLAGLELSLQEPLTGKVTAAFRGVSPDDALAVLLTSVGLEAEREGTTIRVRRGTRPEAGTVILIPRADSTFDLEAYGASLAAVAAELAAADGTEVSVAPGLSERIVASLRGVTAAEAIEALARACRAEVERHSEAIVLEPEPREPLPLLVSLVSDKASGSEQRAERMAPASQPEDDPPDPSPGPLAAARTAEATSEKLVAPEAPPASPAGQADTQATGMVNMEFRDTELPVVLRALCQGAGLDFVLEPGIEGKVTAKLRNTTWEKALEIILRSHGLVATRQGDTLVISRRSEKAPEGPTTRPVRVKRTPDGKFDLDASGADIREALREVAAVAGLNVVASKDVSGQVTASLHGLSPEELLVALADSCGAGLSERGGIILLAPKPISGAGQTRAPTEASKPKIEIKKIEGGRLDVRASNASVRELLKDLSVATGTNIVASPDLKGTIDLALSGVTAQDVLAAIGAHSGVTFRPVGSMLYAAPAPAKLQAETFTLRYCEAKDVVKVLTEALPDAKVAVEEKTNVVVVAGDPAILAAARAIVQGLEKPPTQVTIEARLLETNLTGDEHLGIDWNTSFTFNATFPTVPHTWPLSKNTTMPARTTSSSASCRPAA